MLADEHGLVLEGLQLIVESELEVVGTARDGRTLVDLVNKFRPDLVLTEVTLPLLSGIEAAVRIKKKLPRTHVIFVTRHSDRPHLTAALRAGASGYLIKDCSGSEVVAALRAIMNGSSYITPLVTADLFSTFRENIREGGKSELTPRQREILQLLAEGHSIKQIAGMLNISRKTVEYHKYNLMQASGAETTVQLLQYAIRHGFDAGSAAQSNLGDKTLPPAKLKS